MTDNVGQAKPETEDQKLNDLLDSALQDFDKVSISNIEKDNDTSTMDSQKQIDKNETLTEEDLMKWTEDFLNQTAGDSELKAALQKFEYMPDNNAAEEKDINVDFQSAISQVLKDLTANSEHLQNEADAATVLGQMSLDNDTGDILPFMQGMMKQLLSKEILYPSLKELSDKYPTWLEEHKVILDPLDLQRYTKQSELMQKVCIEFEKEKEDDTEDIKQCRFECVLKLMTEMQNYGEAPNDLVGEQYSFFQFDSEGNPTLPSRPKVDLQQDCCIM